MLLSALLRGHHAPMQIRPWAQRSLLSYPHFRRSASARPMFDVRISAPPTRGDLDSTGNVHRFRGSAPQIKSGAGSAREALSPVRSPAGRLPQKHWLALACNTVATGALQGVCGSAPQIKSGAGSAREAVARSFAGKARSHNSTDWHQRVTPLLHREAFADDLCFLWERAPDQVWGRLCARSCVAGRSRARPAPTTARFTIRTQRVAALAGRLKARAPEPRALVPLQ